MYNFLLVTLLLETLAGHVCHSTCHMLAHNKLLDKKYLTTKNLLPHQKRGK